MTTQQMLDERYGRRRSATARRVTVVVAVLATIAVGAFAWMTVAESMNSVDADATAFQIVDAHSVVLEFQISAPPNAAVACALEAQDQEHGIVGWVVVELPADESHARAYREAIPTTAEATTGFVNSCWVT